MTKLSDTKLRSIKPSERFQKLSDGDGLSFVVKPNGGRYWHFNYRWQGKQRTISFGTYPDTSLKEARRQRQDARELLSGGTDPSQERKRLRQAEKASKASSNGPPTWREIAEGYALLQAQKGRKPKTLAKLHSQLAHTYRSLADLPISDIHAPELLAAVKAIEEQGKLTTAAQVRELCGRVFRYAMATGQSQYDPTPALRDALITPPSPPLPRLN